MPTKRPEAVENADGEWVIRAAPRLEFSLRHVAEAMATTYGEPRAKHGPTNIPGALRRLAQLRLAGSPATAPQDTIAAWQTKLVEWDIPPK